LLRNLGTSCIISDHSSLDIADEETGWYDGQIWVKTPEVLARDRLLGSFSVSILFNYCCTSISNFNVADFR
ncbi:hypothetical protein A2U01_0027583, partial [Trifolium medium]|nr:hypothetical protein [Trifolium medium]